MIGLLTSLTAAALSAFGAIDRVFNATADGKSTHDLQRREVLEPQDYMSRAAFCERRGNAGYNCVLGGNG